MFSIVILNYNDADTTLATTRKYLGFQTVEKVVIVDNASSDDSLPRIKAVFSKDEKVVVLALGSNGGYGSGNNAGLNWIKKNCSSHIALLSNPDAFATEETCIKLEEFLEAHLNYGICAPFMLDAKGNKQYNTAFEAPTKRTYIKSIGLLGNHKKRFYYSDILSWVGNYRDVGSVAGSLFMINLDAFQGDLFDEKMFLYCEEVVVGLRMRNWGLKVALMPELAFVHNHGTTITKIYKKEISKKKLLNKSKLYVIKHYYSANWLEMLWAKLLSKISVLETALLERRKNHGDK